MATQDGTSVTITPTAAIPTHPAGVPYTIALNRGQTYQGRADAGNADLTGTLITSSAPIAVFGAVRCVNIPNSGTLACDHIVEQIPPTSTWGRNFVSVPLATRLNGDTFRFLAQENGTVVSVNGVVVATLNRGQVHERQIVGRASITATDPILVAQFSNGSTWDGVTSELFMMLIPPARAVPRRLHHHHAGHRVRTELRERRGAELLDRIWSRRTSAPIPAAAFLPIPGASFSGAQRTVTLGSHHFSGPQPFGVFTYGFDSFELGTATPAASRSVKWRW